MKDDGSMDRGLNMNETIVMTIGAVLMFFSWGRPQTLHEMRKEAQQEVRGKQSFIGLRDPRMKEHRKEYNRFLENHFKELYEIRKIAEALEGEPDVREAPEVRKPVRTDDLEEIGRLIKAFRIRSRDHSHEEFSRSIRRMVLKKGGVDLIDAGYVEDFVFHTGGRWTSEELERFYSTLKKKGYVVTEEQLSRMLEYELHGMKNG